MKRKEDHDRTTCGHCKGRGWIPLTGTHKETLDLLRRQKEPITGAKFSVVAKCKDTAMNNRLSTLFRLGFVCSRVWGRERLYVAKENFMGGEGWEFH